MKTEKVPMDIILVIGDSATVRHVLVNKLKDLPGCEIKTANDGRDGIRSAIKYRPIMIILDVSMPGIDGFETCEKLKTFRETKGIPIIFHTAESNDTDVLRGFEVGGIDYISKTWNHEIQRQRIGAHLKTLRDARDLKKQFIKNKELMEIQREVENRLLEKNNELKEFAHIVSHDLKAPLRGVETIVQWMKEDYSEKLDSDGNEQLDLLGNRVSRMQSLIDGILRYSKIDFSEEVTEEINTELLITDIVDLLAPPDSISITIAKEMPMIISSATKISQVFQNFISNAIKYMGKPEGEIFITSADLGEEWEFCIRDTGIGIDEQYYEKIFKMFQTLQSRDDYESTGVGLPVIKKIVESYGGKIRVESELNKGSSFFFTYPKNTH